jgi:hypothetical protein
VSLLAQALARARAEPQRRLEQTRRSLADQELATQLRQELRGRQAVGGADAERQGVELAHL